MERHAISFDESCSRPCALRIVECGGPTAHGLDGHVCERCLESVVASASNQALLKPERCAYCGSSPAFTPIRTSPVCLKCALKALSAARSWYDRRSPST